MENVKWIFFDIGSTLVDETECYKKRYAEIVKGTEISAEEFENKAIEYARENKKGDHEAAKFYGLSLPKWHKKAERLYPDAVRVLIELKEQGYRLGIIANQSVGTRERLSVWNILRYFDVIIASAEEGVAKPDAEIFLRALQRTNCPPENAVMVGDRLDNDIVPAKRIGMKTVWVRQGFARYSMPQSPEEEPDCTVERIGNVPGIF